MKFSTKVAVIGFGHLGKWHTEKAHGLANLVAIVEKGPENQAKAKKLYPECKVVDDIHDVVDEIDAAIIVTPTSTHYDLLKFLMEKQKHIFCEKPLCSNDKEAALLKDAHKNFKGICQVGHSERFHASWEIIEKYQKYLQEPCFIRMNRFAPFKGRATDVDVVQDLMIHDLDLLGYLFNEKPISVKSTGYKIRTQNWDYVCSQFSFKSERQAFLVASRNHVKEVRDLEVFSDVGCLFVDLFRNQMHIASQYETSSGEFIETLDYNKRDHLLIEQEHFYQSIEKKEQAIVTFEDGLLAVHLISKVLESLDTGLEVAIHDGE
jgi:predicted dehydrogenase